VAASELLGGAVPGLIARPSSPPSQPGQLLSLLHADCGVADVLNPPSSNAATVASVRTA
jgi:hypothetical protein